MSERKTTTVHCRYHIGEAQVGLLDTAATRQEAFDIAGRWVDGLPNVTVFDSMARRGCAQVWQLYRPGWWRVVEWRSRSRR